MNHRLRTIVLEASLACGSVSPWSLASLLLMIAPRPSHMDTFEGL